MRVDAEKLELLLNRLMAAFDIRRYPFDRPWAQPPQIPENMPKNLKLGSSEHALFLFCLCYYMRGLINSETAIKLLAKVYENKPEMFIPEKAIEKDPKEIAELLQTVGLGVRSEEIGRFWVENFKMLIRHWGGSPVKLFEGVETYEEACERITNKKIKKNRLEKKYAGFFGFQEKMASMLIYFLLDAGFIDPFHFPPPVDFHVLRIMFSHEIFILEGENGSDYKKITDCVRELLSDYIRKCNANLLKMCEGMWIISRMLCERHPGNSSKIGKRKDRKTEIKAIPVIWNKSQRNSYFLSCGSCPIEKTCRYNIPSADYYSHAKIIIRGERQKPPQTSFLFE